MKMNNWKVEMKHLRLCYIQNVSPGFFEASGGFTMAVKPYRDNTANSLTNSICDFLKFKGNYANRINSQGQARVEKIQLAFGNVREKINWTPGSTNKGTADIFSIINGKAVSIEIKIGADRMSKAQHEEKARFEQAGGHYIIASDFPAFLAWYTAFNHVANPAR